MTIGALLYAFDCEICYTKLAVGCARRIQKYLNIPVSLVTDSEVNDSVFDHVILLDKKETSNRRWWSDTNTTTSWKNFSRSTAFDLSPYGKTLLVDVDYLVNSNNLLQVLNATNPLYAHRSVRSVHLPGVRNQKFGTKNTDMWWATVVVFDKSNFSKDVFTIWKMVENNYKYYADFFGFNVQQFRNDHALSIALLIANGGIIPDWCNIPWPLVNADPEVTVTKDFNEYKIYYTAINQGQKKYKRIEIKNQDLHVMGKSYLEQIYAL